MSFYGMYSVLTSKIKIKKEDGFLKRCLTLSKAVRLGTDH